MYRRRFPPKRHLLTQEEYYQQTVKETAQSLSELRTYLNSPECKQWNLITKLHNPMRFAAFANGAPHLDDEEIEDYSRAIEESLEAANEEDPEEFLQCSMYYRPSADRRLSALDRANQRHRVNIPLPTAQSRNRLAVPEPQEEESDDEDEDEYMDQP